MTWVAVWAWVRRVPWQAWAGVGLALACWWLYRHGVNVGVERALTQIERANQQAEELADQAQVGVDECFARGEPWGWDREARTCVKR